MSDDISNRKKPDVGPRQGSSRETASSRSDMSVYKSSTAGSLRYKGRKELSVYKSSDDFFQYSCGPCSSEGDHFEGEVFCTDCGEYLCGVCFRSHSRGKATKDHTLLLRDNMEIFQTCDPCKSVGEKIEAIGYCDDCDEYLCRSCFRSHSRSKATKHHNLIDKGNMPEESFSAVAPLITKIDIRKDGAMYQKPIESYNLSDESSGAVASSIAKIDIHKDSAMYQKPIESCNLSEESFSAVAPFITKIDIRKDGAMYQKPIESYNLSDESSGAVASSIAKIDIRKDGAMYQKPIESHNLSEESFSAVVSSNAKTDVHKDGAMYQKPIESYRYVEDINVKAAEDARNCYIVAMTQLSNHELVLADYDNVSLKHVDVARNVINGTLGLESVPYGLTTVSKNDVAVSLPIIYVIRIVTISGTISVKRNIKLTGLCLDIAYLNGKLYASFEKDLNFKILQPSGEVYKTTEPDAELQKHCKAPRYIAVSPNESVIYMSDWTTNKVVCMDIDGNMISMYQSELKKPKDIVVTPFGSVYLCNKNQHVIDKMTPDLRESTVILGPEDGLFSPLAMCFNCVKQHLYISIGSDEAEKCNHIKVFKWQ